MRFTKLISISLLIAVGLLHGQTFPHIRYYYFNGPYKVVAGSTSVFEMRPLLAFNFTCAVHGVCTVTTSGVTLTNGDIVTTDSSGTLPGGIDTIIDGEWPNYDICNVSGSTFNLKQDAGNFSPPGPCTGTQVDVTNVGSGAHFASLYQFNTIRIYQDSNPTGFPGGSSFQTLVPLANRDCNFAAPTTNGRPYSDGESIFCVPVTVPSNATPGTGTTHWTFCANSNGTNCTTFDWPINVVPPANVSYTPPSSFTTMPGKTAWETRMTFQCAMLGTDCLGAGPANYCYPLANPMAGQLAPSLFSIGYYGWGIFWHYITRYTGDPVYTTGCAQQSANLTRDLIVSHGGVEQPCCHFTETMYLAERAFGGGSYQSAGNLMQNNVYAKFGPTNEFQTFRETAYGLKDCVALYKYGGITCPKLGILRDSTYSLVLMATETTGTAGRPIQGFMLALAMDAIIEDFQAVSHDPRAPYVAKLAADYIQANVVNNTYMNIAAANGTPFCSDSTPPPWFLVIPGQTGRCDQNSDAYKHLQMMVTEFMFWYYSYTGNTTYRDNADALFQHAWDAENVYGIDGKSASEDYYLSFSSVCWRTGACSAYQYYGDARSSTVISGRVTISGGSKQ